MTAPTPRVSGIFLSRDDIARLRRTNQVLLNPHGYVTLDAWRAAALDAVVDCLGADKGILMFRKQDGTNSVTSKEIPRAQEYDGAVSPLANPLGIWARQWDLVTWTRASLWGRHYVEMLRSAYYQDLVRSQRAFDAVGVTVPTDANGGLATFNLHHGDERGIRFGERGQLLLQLIEPAFRAGVALALCRVDPLLKDPRRVRCDAASVLPMLTSRELEVVRLLAKRHTNREIASTLGVAPGTIKRHVENILRKVGVQSRRELEPLLDRDP